VGTGGEHSAATGIGGDQADNSAARSGAVYLFERNGTWAQHAYVKASNSGAADLFGTSVALSGNGSILAVGAPGEGSSATGIDGDQTDNAAPGAGAVYVFTRSGATWIQQAYVKASNPGTSDGFGRSVALSGDGSILAVGAPGEDSAAAGIDGDQTDNSLSHAGAVYVFARSGATWSQQAYVKASNTDPEDHFGSSLALSADGSSLAVGATGEDSDGSRGGLQSDNSSSSTGAVYAFTRTGTTWSQRIYLKASNPDAGDELGAFVALSGDGSRLAVGAPLEDGAATGLDGNQADNSALNAGAVYVFH
jgi:hypothetical protein